MELTASQRYQARQKLLKQGLPIPPELQKRPNRLPTDKYTGTGRERSNQRAASYRERHREEIKEKARQKRSELARAIEHIKAQPCADCDQSFPAVCMDFDHKGSDKVASVATMISNCWPLEQIMAEIAKCDLVCSNCHRIRTGKELGWNEELLNFSGVLPG